MCVGIFNSLLLSSTRVFFTMAQDKFLPAFFAKSHKKLFTPYVSILFCAFVYSILILFDFQKLVIYDVLLYLFAMLLEAFALVALRKQNKNAKTQFKIPFGLFGMYFIVSMTVVIILFMTVLNFMDFKFSFGNVFLAGFLIFGGMPVYYSFRFFNKKALS